MQTLFPHIDSPATTQSVALPDAADENREMLIRWLIMACGAALLAYGTGTLAAWTF